MKNSILRLTLVITSTMIMAPTFAHDPAEHAKTAEAPDCESMKSMDHSKMDMNDPVMLAMMKKCSNMQKHSEKAMEEMDHTKMESMDHKDMNEMEKNKTTSSASHEGHGTH